MKYINQFCRFTVGILFIVSGLIKLNDPIGTAIKMEEYFEVFAHDFHPVFEHLTSVSLLIAITMLVAEVVLGIAVLIYYRMQLTSWLLMSLIVFFTFLTFYSAYFNKVTDCGCFGDAIKLTPWTSFGKDVVLLVLITLLFIQRSKLQPAFQTITTNILMALSVLFSLYIAYFTINHLSFVDLRAYKPGADIRKLMKPSAPIHYLYTLTKDGKDYEFTKYPTDTSYHYKSMDIINKEDLPKITDYAIWNDESDFTQESLTGKKLLVFVLKTQKKSTKNISKINELGRKLAKNGIETWLVTASDYASMLDFRNEHQLAFPFFYADATIIKTVIRSNPGLVLMQDGIVRGKWHHNDVPEIEQVLESLK
jgi:uncharacterized membrane protein YphA (DoxX/SURF4 family)